ncbi:MAG: ATP-dependent helicase, partial [Steroidobacteraceae bacterium]|nr:ATP-dependent helicase [Steroidobacteraceae bacterium]MDW8258442.1 ATP-dependent helicase [Gammaproteobacteria bacterium]
MNAVAQEKPPVLNSAQKRAVTFGAALPDKKGFTSGPLLIIAGAGTGKTHTLAQRVAHLVLNGVDPARILLLTFTRRAAQEMRRRARDVLRGSTNDVLGGPAQKLSQRLTWAGTFHSIGNRLLRHYAKHINLDPNYSVLDRSDAADLLDTVREEIGLADQKQRFPRKDTCLAIYSYRINTQYSLADTLARQFPWCAEWESELTKLFRAYVARKQQLALLDYDDLLLYWHLMMQEARIAQHIGRNFDHVLVDEYQDTNALQAQILYALKPDGRGVTVVGDDAQAIYSFRAGLVDNILGFPDKFTPRAEVIPLSQNYRSTQELLNAANALMAEAPRQFRKHLISGRGDGGKARYVTTDDLVAQAEFICAEVLRRREAQSTLRSQAVLFRHQDHSDLLEIELMRRKIPFVKYGGLKFLEAAHVKDLLSILRWIDNPRNQIAAFRALQLLPGFGPGNARKALDLFAGADYQFASLKAFQPPNESRIVWPKFVEMLTTLAQPRYPWAGQVHTVREWYKPHFERLYEHHHTRISDLEQLELLSAHYTSREQFLTELTLDPPQATSDLAGQALQDEDYLV